MVGVVPGNQAGILETAPTPRPGGGIERSRRDLRIPLLDLARRRALGRGRRSAEPPGCLKLHVYGLDVAVRGVRVVLGTGFIDVRRWDFRAARLEDLVEICGSVAPEGGKECVRRSTTPVVLLVLA